MGHRSDQRPDVVSHRRRRPDQPTEHQSPWRQVIRRYPPADIATRYARLVELRARHADLSDLASFAREDMTRLASALHAVLSRHTPDARGRCQGCSQGPYLVEAPCDTRRAAEAALRGSWPGGVPMYSDLTPPTNDADDPDANQFRIFTFAVLALHPLLPASGCDPPRCRTCQATIDRCAVWSLSDGLLNITPPRRPQRMDDDTTTRDPLPRRQPGAALRRTRGRVRRDRRPRPGRQASGPAHPHPEEIATATGARPLARKVNALRGWVR